jgi:hypothetical protein
MNSKSSEDLNTAGFSRERAAGIKAREGTLFGRHDLCIRQHDVLQYAGKERQNKFAVCHTPPAGR